MNFARHPMNPYTHQHCIDKYDLHNAGRTQNSIVNVINASILHSRNHSQYSVFGVWQKLQRVFIFCRVGQQRGFPE